MKDTFFTQTHCDRCGSSLQKGRTMSMYNKDCICIQCKENEMRRPDYEDAVKADREAQARGDYNFLGIGFTNADNNGNNKE